MSGVILEADDLHLRFGGVQAANGASLKVAANERIAIIGPNGAGKTTFINLCTGYLKPQSGRVVFNGQDVTRLSPQAITRLGIGRSFQIPQLFLDNTVIENLFAGALGARGLLVAFPRRAAPSKGGGDVGAAGDGRAEGDRQPHRPRIAGGHAQADRHRSRARARTKADFHGRARPAGCPRPRSSR